MADDVSDTDERARATRADAKLQVAQQKEREREAAWADVAATARRTDENTVRLKALRLAKQKADMEAAAALAATKTTTVKRRKTTAKS